jgi:hypothetical protein
MLKPLYLTALLAYTAYYKSSFNFFALQYGYAVA